jgi:hypothetical protein
MDPIYTLVPLILFVIGYTISLRYRASKPFNPNAGKVLVHLKHRREIAECLMDPEYEDGPFLDWLRSIQNSDGSTAGIEEFLGKNLSFAKQRLGEPKEIIHKHHRFNSECKPFQDVTCPIWFNLQPWEKISALRFGYPCIDGQSLRARSAFQYYREQLELNIGPPKTVEGDDTINSEHIRLTWCNHETQLILSLYLDGRDQFLCCNLSLENKVIKEVSEEMRLKYNKVYCDVYARRPGDGYNYFPIHRINKNLDRLLQATTCHILDNGICDDLLYRDIDKYWLLEIGTTSSALGENYRDIPVGYTGGQIRVFDSEGCLLVERSY